MKTLYITRHAKSDWNNSLADFDRPLNDRGMGDAPFMAEKIREAGVAPDLIISSPAKRAITTARFFAEALSYPEEKIRQEQGIYEFGIKFILDMLEKLDNSLETVMLFGHNPDLSMLCTYLSGAQVGSLATCTTAGIRFAFDDWGRVKKENGELFLREFPKKYTD